MVEHLLQVETCSGVVNQTMYHCSRIRKSLILVWLNSINSQNIDLPLWQNCIPGVEDLLVCGRASYAGGNVFRSSQSILCTTAVGSERRYSRFDSVYMARTLTCLYGKTVFKVSRILLVYGRACSTGGNVFRSSQLTLCTTAVGSESLYSWLDSVYMARTLTWQSMFCRWKRVQV